MTADFYQRWAKWLQRQAAPVLAGFKVLLQRLLDGLNVRALKSPKKWNCPGTFRNIASLKHPKYSPTFCVDVSASSLSPMRAMSYMWQQADWFFWQSCFSLLTEMPLQMSEVSPLASTAPHANQSIRGLRKHAFSTEASMIFSKWIVQSIKNGVTAH